LAGRLAIVPDLGTIVPNMGMKPAAKRPRKSANLADALFTPVQQRVLGLLFGQPQRHFQSAELIKLAGSGTGAVHRVLTRLADAGLIAVTHSGNQKHYQANRDSPVFADLQGLIVKTVGVVEPLRQALASKARMIHAAFVYGSVAKRTDRADSDIDLMVISDTLAYPDLFALLQKAETTLGRPVNPNVMTRQEWRKKRAQTDSFAARIAAQPKLFVMGSDDDLD
jgi:predicted nucleotidyltransferase